MATEPKLDEKTNEKHNAEYKNNYKGLNLPTAENPMGPQPVPFVIKGGGK